MNIGTPSITPFKSDGLVGQIVTETASIAYTGALLPVGSLPDATKRYLKNSGKDKTPALVESGQGKFFNGTSQYIDTGIVPNQAQGTLVTRFTYATGMVSRFATGSMSSTNSNNDRVIIGINSNGKIFGCIGDVLTTTSIDTRTLINGQSYHVALKYSGLMFSLYVDSILINTWSAGTMLTPINALYIGAHNASNVGASYFNNVIDETYYYDVALSDAQIGLLYSYPEKVKAYNGAIVPDIGSEANCKLFLPLCENSGSNVVNVAVARGSELVVNGGFDTDTAWVKGVGMTISGGMLNVNSAGYIGAGSTNISFTATKQYVINFNITSLTSGSIKVYFADSPVFNSPYFTAIGSCSVIFIATTTFTNRLNFETGASGFVGSIDNVLVKEITAYPLTNYTTAMHTSAAKLSYGAQCTAWKRDSLGVLLGMSGGLSFDGGVSVKYPVVSLANVIPDTTPIVMEAVMYCEVSSDYKFIMGSNLLRLGIDAAGEPWTRVGSYQASITPTANTTSKNAYHHIVVQSNGTVINAWVDGIQYKTNTAFTTGGVDGANFVLGSSGWDKPYKRIAGTPKIHKGTQYAKFDIAKAWIKAQKTIAKLGA